jgi:hypothetical protein
MAALSQGRVKPACDNPRVMKALLFTMVLVAAAAPAPAQWLNQPTRGIPRTPDGKPNLSAPAPRAADGKPDLSGIWNKLSPKYHRNIVADLQPDEIQPWVHDLVKERAENLGKDYMNVVCLPLGPGYVTAADVTGAEQVKIVQTPTLIVMLNPDLTYRQIFMDGRALEASPNPSWMGYSIGHWEGDTLVVDSNGFNAGSWLDHDGRSHTEALRMTERYRRRDFGHLEVEVTLSDPGAYSRPWTVAVQAALAPDTEMIEWVCTENRRMLDHWVGKASDERKGEVAVAPEILAKYVGTYEEQKPYWRQAARVVTIAVRNGKVIANMDGRGEVELIATSNTEFAGLYGLGVEFIQDGAAGLYVKHVSGNYRFARK